MAKYVHENVIKDIATGQEYVVISTFDDGIRMLDTDRAVYLISKIEHFESDVCTSDMLPLLAAYAGEIEDDTKYILVKDSIDD